MSNARARVELPSSAPGGSTHVYEPQGWVHADTQTVRHVQLALLDQFAAFCHENDLAYSLAAGSLLGAVRHKGFIPWDDDVDVMMPRQDYDRLLLLADELRDTTGTELAFGGKGQRGYPYPYAKLMQPDTLVVEELGAGGDLGINIDIFPVDVWPERLWARRLLRSYVHNLGHLIRLRGWQRTSESWGLALLLVLVRAATFVMPMAAVRSAITSAAGLFARSGSGTVGIIVWGYHEQFPMDSLLPTQPLTFEGRDVAGPGHADRVLSSMYGSYMQLPPVEQRVAPHAFVAYLRAHRSSSDGESGERG